MTERGDYRGVQGGLSLYVYRIAREEARLRSGNGDDNQNEIDGVDFMNLVFEI